MAGPEARVKLRVKSILKKNGAYQHWPVQTGYGAACLDCHGCHKRRYFAVETKAPGKHPTPRQLLTIGEIEDAGGAVFVIGEYKRGDKIYPKGPLVEEEEYSGIRELEIWLSTQT